jgi:hypothetical protein
VPAPARVPPKLNDVFSFQRFLKSLVAFTFGTIGGSIAGGGSGKKGCCYQCPPTRWRTGSPKGSPPFFMKKN